MKGITIYKIGGWVIFWSLFIAIEDFVLGKTTSFLDWILGLIIFVLVSMLADKLWVANR